MSTVNEKMVAVSDEDLFKKPPPKEDCPICMLPLPTLDMGSKYKACCGKEICSGCIYAVEKRDGGVGLCPFCRTPTPTAKEMIEMSKKRVEIGDANAMFNLGCNYAHGDHGLAQDSAKALQLWHQAAELGCAAAYNGIGVLYYNGNGVERDEKKAEYYYTQAALSGGVSARHNLGNAEGRKGNMDRALKHFKISVEFGLNESLDTVRQMFMNGNATKEDYTNALRAYQTYLGEVKSVQRDQATAISDRYKCY